MCSPTLRCDAFPATPCCSSKASRPAISTLDGWVRLYRQTADGRESLIALFARGEAFAEAVMFLGGKFPVSGATVEEVGCWSSRPSLSAARSSNNELCFKMMASMAIHLRHLVVQVEQLTVRVHGADRTVPARTRAKRCRARSCTSPTTRGCWRLASACSPRRSRGRWLAAAARRRDQRQPGHNSRHRCPAAPLHGTGAAV